MVLELNTGSNIIKPSTDERLLGVNMSNDFTWNAHVLPLVKKLTLKNNGLQKVGQLMDFKSRKMLANGIINSQLIYCVQLFAFASSYLLRFLQVQQNRAARIVTRLDRSTEVSVLLQQVGWLSVKQLYVYHCLLLLFKTQRSKRPEYFISKMSRSFPYATRRSQNNSYSITGIPRTETFKRSFFQSSINMWNNLPADIRILMEVGEFKRKLKIWTQNSVPLL